MKKKITRLACAGMASCCVLMAAGQEKAAEVRIIDRYDLSESRSELLAGKRDSIISYDDMGNREGYMGNTRAMTEEGRPKIVYIDDDEGGQWLQPTYHHGHYFFSDSEFDVKYNSNGLVESLSYSFDNTDCLREYKYNANGYLISADEYLRPAGGSESEWEHRFNYLYLYDSYGNWVGHQMYWSNGDIMTPIGEIYSARSDNKGRIVYGEIRNADGSMIEVNGRESKYKYFIWYYSDHTPNAEVENNTPIGSDNQGSFDLNVNIPTDSISSGSVTVTFPEGFTLDEENTSLTLDFAADFTLTITKQENNSWLLEIKPKALRNASLRADEVQNAIQIAYLVDEEVKRGSYDISVNSILFETPYGNIIPEPAITVPVNVNRWGVANEGIEDANTVVYITGNTLYIQTPQSETVAIYAINGSKLYEATVPSGTVTVDASAFPQGVLIVKGSSGWVKKVVRGEL